MRPVLQEECVLTTEVERKGSSPQGGNSGEVEVMAKTGGGGGSVDTPLAQA